MAVAVNSNTSNTESHGKTISINLIVSIGFLSTLFLIILLILFIFYLQFLNNRIIDLTPISLYYHSTIRNIFVNILMLDFESSQLTETQNKNRLGLFCEYTVLLKPWQNFEEIDKELRKRLYEAGLSVDTNTSEDLSNEKEIQVSTKEFKIAKIFLKKENISVPFKEKLLTEKIKEYENKIKHYIYLYVSPSETIESLPELYSDDNNIWYHKNISLIQTIISNNEHTENENILFTKIESYILNSFPEIEITKNAKLNDNKIEMQLYYKGKHFLTISLRTLGEFSKTNHDNEERNSSLHLINPKNSLTPIDLNTPLPSLTLSNWSNSQDNNSDNIITKKFQNEFYPEYENNKDSQSADGEYKIAIILDDGGYRNPAEDPVLELPNKITLSIIPDTQYAIELAKIAEEKGFEVMIHMPMQTRLGVKKGSLPSELLINMKEEEIREKTLNAIRHLPQAKGINNHTGGVFTTKEEPLRYLMKILKEQELYFIDSVVIGSSKAYQIALEEGVPSLPRDLFLDHEYSTAKIKECLLLLKQMAKKKGQAIAIGHFRDLTIKVLKEELPKFEEEGYKLVHISELLEVKTQDN